ncbi:MAG: acyltransferase family protein [Janthinobacterium lividum]
MSGIELAPFRDETSEQVLDVAQQRRVFHVLDMLRGIAAIMVVTLHNPYLWWWLDLPESFLAVDLFFVMSGVVIANSYEGRLLRGAPPMRFMGVRIIRLYPLYLLSLVLGIAATALGGFRDEWTRLPPAMTWLDGVVSALFMLPAVAVPQLINTRWTLTFEMAVNAAYGFLIRRLTTPVLIGIVAIAGAGIIRCVMTHGTLNFGWRLETLWVGSARVCYSFFLGVLIFRLSKGRTHPSMLVVALLVCVTAILLGFSTSNALLRDVWELGAVLVAFPVIVWLAIGLEVGPRARKAFAFFGLVSYGVYIIHQPAGVLFARLIGALGAPVRHPPIAFSLVYLALVIGGVWLLDRFYDAPVRRSLSTMLGPFKARAQARNAGVYRT